MYQKGSPISSDAFIILPAGEPITVRTFVEIHADGKLYIATEAGSRAVGVCVLPPDSVGLTLVQVAGQVSGFTGFTPGQLLYQQNSGQVSAVSTQYALALALSATSLLLTPGGGGGTPVPTTEINDAVTSLTSTWSSQKITEYLQSRLVEYYDKQAFPALAHITEGTDTAPLWKGQPWPCSAQVTGCTVRRCTGTASCANPSTPVLVVSLRSLVEANVVPSDFMVTTTVLVTTPDAGAVIFKDPINDQVIDIVEVTGVAPMVLVLRDTLPDVYITKNCTVSYTSQFIYWKGGKAAVTRRTLVKEGDTSSNVISVFDLATWTATVIGTTQYFMVTTLHLENRGSDLLHFTFTYGTLTMEAGIILPGHTEILQPGFDGWQLLLNGNYKLTLVITYFC